MRPHVDEQKRRNNPNSHPAKTSAGYCKKLKGPHDYHLLKRETYNRNVIDRNLNISTKILIFITDQCSGCSKLKKHLKWEPIK